MASRNEGASHPQDPRKALEEFAGRATRYSVNLNGCVSKNNAHLLRGSGAIIRSGTIDLAKMADKVGAPDGRLWENIYGNRVAIKSPCAGPPSGESNIKKFLKEVHVWSKLKHANVHPLLGITTEFEMTVSIVSPWMENGNAHDHVQNEAVDPRPLIKGIAKGLYYLHTYPPNPIFHGDLKGVNVLISNNGEALLTDFGFSVAVNSSFSMTMSNTKGTKGTLRWMAPEILDGGAISPKADVWAFGMTALELFTRKDPFHHLPTTAAIVAAIVKDGPDRPSTNDTYARMTDKWWDICSECWRHEPSSRPLMSHISQTIARMRDMSHAAIPNGIRR